MRWYATVKTVPHPKLLRLLKRVPRLLKRAPRLLKRAPQPVKRAHQLLKLVRRLLQLVPRLLQLVPRLLKHVRPLRVPRKALHPAAMKFARPAAIAIWIAALVRRIAAIVKNMEKS